MPRRYIAHRSDFLRDGDNSIVSNTSSTNPFQEYIRTNAESQINLTALSFTHDTVKDLFRQIAVQERSKEIALLEKFLPDEKWSDTDSLIDKINILMQGRERYSQVLDRISTALQKDKTSGAPNMSTFFASYLNPIITQKMSEFQSNFINYTDPRAEYNRLINEAMSEASTKMALASEKGNKTSDSLAGGKQDWSLVNKALKSDKNMWNLFVNNIKKTIGNWDELYNALIIQQNTVKEDVNNILKLNSRMFSIGGNVAENAYAAVAVHLNKIRGSTHSGDMTLQWKTGGGALTVEGPATTDSFVVFSASSNISPTKVFNDLNAATNKNYKEKLTTAVTTFKDNLDNLFGVFVNAKNFGLGKSQDTVYTKNINGTFEELPSAFNELQINVSNIRDFITTAYNTATGAIGEGMKGEVEESLVQALRYGAAKIMFDDYELIGSSSGNVIHLYQLSGKFIPSSVIFDCLAGVKLESAVSVKANVKLPGDLGEISKNIWKGLSDQEGKNAIYAEWDKRFLKAKEEAAWAASFTINVKKVLNAM